MGETAAITISIAVGLAVAIVLGKKLARTPFCSS